MSSLMLHIHSISYSRFTLHVSRFTSHVSRFKIPGTEIDQVKFSGCPGKSSI